MDDPMKIYKLFKEYKKRTGGENAIGYSVVGGLPEGVEDRGGIVAVYEECIRKGITWEKLLDYHDDTPPDAII